MITVNALAWVSNAIDWSIKNCLNIEIPIVIDRKFLDYWTLLEYLTRLIIRLIFTWVSNAVDCLIQNCLSINITIDCSAKLCLSIDIATTIKNCLSIDIAINRLTKLCLSIDIAIDQKLLDYWSRDRDCLTIDLVIAIEIAWLLISYSWSKLLD